MEIGRAVSYQDIITRKYIRLNWGDKWLNAFGNPEDRGTIFIWGNSANAKTGLLMQMMAELGKQYKCFYNSREEGNRLTLQESVIKYNLDEVKRNILFGDEDFNQLHKRLSRRKSPKIIIIDSTQYMSWNFKDYMDFTRSHPDKRFIISSMTDGKDPIGETAKRIKHDADLKIWVEGGKAISMGRYNAGGEYIIWDELSNKYWGIES